ncbi:MAG: CvpA family protein [Thermoguttaceae bacterium]
MSWAFVFPLLLLLIFLLCVGFSFAEGMWSNAIRLINVVTAGLIAMNFWEPLARWAEENIDASYTYFYDFLALWGLFVVSLMLLRLVTDTVSRVKVRFLRIADQIGSAGFAAASAWVLVCFTTATLHTAPLSVNPFFGGFKPEGRMFFGLLAPDIHWLGFTQYVSKGVYSRGLSDQEIREGKYASAPTDPERTRRLAVFDRRGRFIPTYASRRAEVEKLADTGSFRVQSVSNKR